MSRPTVYFDEAGRKWQLYSLRYRHEIDEQTFEIDLWAIDWADAEERLEFIKSNGRISAQIIKVIDR